MTYWKKKILTVMLQYDYGDKNRGYSGEKMWFHDNLKKMSTKVEAFWYDDYLNDKFALEKDLMVKIDSLNPDLIFFVLYQDQFDPNFLKRLKEKYCTYCWFGDDQWRFDNFTKIYAPCFSFVSTTDPWSIIKYNKIGISPILTDWAAQQYSEEIGPLDLQESYNYEVTFVGGYNHYRGWLINTLTKKHGINVECFGTGWPNGRVSYEQMENIFRKSKINLNISNSASHDIRFIFGDIRNLKEWLTSTKRSEQVKARNFEIPLAGGFQLTNYSLGLERHFIIGDEVAVYNNPEECANQIFFYLENDGLRRGIVQKSHTKAKENHNYIERLNSIMENIFNSASKMEKYGEA
ncbi:glycosyltransferase [Paenibacillus aurantius]|uniref:Glycosyltransferase n=1 Tax=Paenibacillus aurantius TaxID=2918900 RepID=A0AA96LBV6_9BACL|nr:glycosyltransferase [Paenibacillus aurantius]WNQ10425.1 glycosyltransferase [Paenibacillus aurantius]